MRFRDTGTTMCTLSEAAVTNGEAGDCGQWWSNSTRAGQDVGNS